MVHMIIMWNANSITKLIGNRYMLQGKLGEGGFCVVYKAKDLFSPKLVAIKCSLQQLPNYRRHSPSEIRQKMKEQLCYEAESMRELQHPNIVRFIELIDPEINPHIVMEYVQGGELFERILAEKKFCEQDAIHCIRQVLMAVEYMHSKGYVHRDLKPENILLSDNSGKARVIVTDFGLSRRFLGQDMYTVCGTLEYCAPEMLVAHELRRSYGPEVDIWSVGVITYILLCGRQPFMSDHGNEAEVRQKILSGHFDMKNLEDTLTGKQGRNFVRSILRKNPRERPSVRSLLESEWLEREDMSSTENIYKKIGKNLRQKVNKRKWECLNFAAHIMNMMQRSTATPRLKSDSSNMSDCSSLQSSTTVTETFPNLSPADHT